MQVRRKYVARVATELLGAYGIASPPVDVEAIARRLGLDVRRNPNSRDDLSGFLLRQTGRDGGIIGVNDSHAPNRQRFTIAHEIGHHLLHPADELYVDQTGRGLTIQARDQQSSEGTNPQEIEANLFAAALLMPEEFLQEDLAQSGDIDLEDDHALSELAQRYQVSVQSLTFRLANLGFVNI